MLTEICNYLHNYFDRGQPRWTGKITLNIDGTMLDGTQNIELLPGQYFRILGSVLNDGVYQYQSAELTPEVFNGTIQSMAVPKVLLTLADEIEAWDKKYGDIDSVNMSPYTSESFDNYSYSKSGGGASTDGNSGNWQSVFAARLNAWRKLP